MVRGKAGYMILVCDSRFFSTPITGLGQKPMAGTLIGILMKTILKLKNARTMRTICVDVLYSWGLAVAIMSANISYTSLSHSNCGSSALCKFSLISLIQQASVAASSHFIFAKSKRSI